jgi:hypothetical protein
MKVMKLEVPLDDDNKIGIITRIIEGTTIMRSHKTQIPITWEPAPEENVKDFDFITYRYSLSIDNFYRKEYIERLKVMNGKLKNEPVVYRAVDVNGKGVSAWDLYTSDQPFDWSLYEFKIKA